MIKAEIAMAQEKAEVVMLRGNDSDLTHVGV
jgi:hypothetical protein